MPAAKSVDPGESPLHFFGSELRHHRQRAGLTQEDLGGRISYSGDLVSKIETGEQAPGPDMARRCDEALDTDGALGRLLVMVRWGAFPGHFRPWLEAEREAHTLRSWELAVVPGLLQTADYARELLRAQPGATEGRVEELATARLERQTILARDEPPLMWFVVAERVLHYPVGDSKVMQGQLQALVEWSRHTHVNLQVIPTSAGAHSGMNGAFAIISFDGAPDMVYLETAREGQVTDRSQEVRAITNIFEAIRTEALPSRASLDLITKVTEQWT